MRFNKMICLTVVISALLVVPVFAATGYGPGVAPDVPAFVPTQPGTAEARAVTTARTAIQQAVSRGNGETTITLANTPTLNSATLQEIFDMADRAGVDATVQVDVRHGNSVVSRTIIDAETAAYLYGVIDFRVNLTGYEIDEIRRFVSTFFDNEFTVIRYNHLGAFGRDSDDRLVRVQTAVNASTARLNTSNLRFYALNREHTTFALIETPSTVDRNGFVHFNLPVGGIIIMTDRALNQR